MNDEEFLRALEDTTLPEAEFAHLGHVRAAYLYLRAAPDFAAALTNIARSIRRYATAKGQPGRYHETVTVAYTALINQHLQVAGAAANWHEFAAANPGLLDKRLLSDYIAPETLGSELARRAFILPRRSQKSIDADNTNVRGAPSTR